MPPSEARIQTALEAANAAYWRALADELPETRTGGLDPLTTVAFDDAVERAARAWIDAN
jgi:hypothetical protein